MHGTADTLIFVDAGVLIAAARGDDQTAWRALQAIDRPDVRYASSPLVRLEVLPEPSFHRRVAEVRFYERFFHAVAV